jgi:hypothetical protein
MVWYGKEYNDGDDIYAPRFIPEGKKPLDFIPAGHEDEYIKDVEGNIWSKKDWEEMRIK